MERSFSGSTPVVSLFPVWQRTLFRLSFWMPSRNMFPCSSFKRKSSWNTLKTSKSDLLWIFVPLIYNQLRYWCLRHVLHEIVICLALGKVDVKTQGQRACHRDLRLGKLGHVDEEHLACARKRGLEGDPLGGAFCFHCTKNILHMRWVKGFLHHQIYITWQNGWSSSMANPLPEPTFTTTSEFPKYCTWECYLKAVQKKSKYFQQPSDLDYAPDKHTPWAKKHDEVMDLALQKWRAAERDRKSCVEKSKPMESYSIFAGPEIGIVLRATVENGANFLRWRKTGKSIWATSQRYGLILDQDI